MHDPTVGLRTHLVGEPAPLQDVTISYVAGVVAPTGQQKLIMSSLNGVQCTHRNKQKIYATKIGTIVDTICVTSLMGSSLDP